MTPLAVTLRTLREAAGLTQRGLAEKSGVHRGTLQNLEHSRVARPHQHVIDALADALGVQPAELTTEVFDPERPTQRRETASAPAVVAPEPSEPSAEPPNSALVALAAAVQGYDPLAEIAIDGDGPAVAVLLTDGTLLYLRSKYNWWDFLRARGVDPTEDLPDVVHAKRRPQSAASKAILNHLFRG